MFFIVSDQNQFGGTSNHNSCFGVRVGLANGRIGITGEKLSLNIVASGNIHNHCYWHVVGTDLTGINVQLSDTSYLDSLFLNCNRVVLKRRVVEVIERFISN